MTTQPTTIDKRTAILSATLDLISERGFHGAPISLVAKQSGVSTGIIYHYFDNKDALIHELYKDIKARHSLALMNQNPHELDWNQAFEQLWLNAFNFYVAHPKETKFLEQYENSPFIQEWNEEAMLASGDENLVKLMAMIQTQVEEGIVREMPFAVLYELTMGVAIGLAKRQINHMLKLDEATLNETAMACRRAIEVV